MMNLHNRFKQIKTLYLYLFLAVLAVGVYINCIGNDFVFDDESVVVGNQAIQSLENIPKFFTAQEGFHKVIGKYYRPLVLVTYSLDYAFWELKPTGFHLTNIVFHLIATLLLFRILLYLSEQYENGRVGAFLGAIIFAVHPIHTEAVSWISGRTDLFATMLFFASFLYYIKYDRRNDIKLLIYSLVFYVLALLSKEMIVTMPVFIFLYDFIISKRRFSDIKSVILKYGLFVGITIVFVVVRYLLLSPIPEREKYFYFYGKDAATVFFTMLKTIPVYLKLLIYPFNLIYHYNGVIADSNTLFNFYVILSLIVIITFIVIAIVLRKKAPLISFSILFFFASLLPVMNIIPTMNLMAERFLYISSFSLSIVIMWLSIKIRDEKLLKIYMILVFIVTLIFIYGTIRRNGDWKNNETLFKTAEDIDGSVTLVNSGNIYANSGNLEEAARRYRRALEIRDNIVLAHHNLGLYYLLKGNLDSAEIEIKRGMDVDSLAPDGYFQLANIYQQRGNVPQAIYYLEKLQTIYPNYRNSKSILESLKNPVKNTPVPQQENQPGAPLKPDVDALERESFDYYLRKNYIESINVLNKLIEINPQKKTVYYNNIATCYADQKKYEEAIKYFELAFHADTTNANSMNGAAEMYLKLGNKEKAIKLYEKILKVYPNHTLATRKLDSLRRN
ncbi:MAG: tetratricopeptide repeat protein [Ignavibacteria bacterium]